MAGKTIIDVSHVAALANLTLNPAEETKFASQFADTLKTVDLMNELDTSNTLPSFQVTGLSNVTREDVVNKNRVLTQNEALSGAKHVHNGYFVVPAVLHND